MTQVRPTENYFNSYSNLQLSYLGKITRGYDPSQDVIWLRSEIVRWIEGNLIEKWYVGDLMDNAFSRPKCASRGSIKRRHVATSLSSL